MADIYGLQAIIDVQNSTQAAVISQTRDQVLSYLPPELFVTFAALFGGLTVSKSYFDAILAMSSTVPKLVVAIYSILALAFSVMLAMVSSMISNVEVDGSRIYLTQYKVQIIRWSLAMGSIFLSLGPFLLIPPIRKILVSKKTSPVLHFFVSFAQSKASRYTSLAIFMVITLFQFLVAYNLFVVLAYFPWFQMEVVQAITVAFCYIMVSIFYLYAFWYTMVKKEKKEDAFKPNADDPATTSFLKKLRSQMVITYRSESCISGSTAHNIISECPECIKINILDTKGYLVSYLVLFVFINLATLAEEIVFLYIDFKAIIDAGLVGQGSFVVAILFGAVCLLIHITGAVFIFNEAFRIVYEEKDDKKGGTKNTAQKTSAIAEDGPQEAKQGGKNDVATKSSLLIPQAQDNEHIMLLPKDNSDVSLFQEAEKESVHTASHGIREERLNETPTFEVTDPEGGPLKTEIILDDMDKGKSSTDAKKKRASPRKEVVRESANLRVKTSRTPPPPPPSAVSLDEEAIPSSAALAPAAPSPGSSPNYPPPPPPPSSAPAPSPPVPVVLPKASLPPRPLSTVEQPKLKALAEKSTRHYSESRPEGKGAPTITSHKVVDSSAFDDIMESVEADTAGQDNFYSEESVSPSRQRSDTISALTGSNVNSVFRWLEKEERIRCKEGVLPPIHINAEFLYAEFLPILKKYGPSLFGHFVCWILVQAKRELTTEQELALVTVPQSFDPDSSDTYADKYYFKQFKDLFMNYYAHCDPEWLTFDESFESVEDAKKVIYCLFHMMTHRILTAQ